MNEYFENLTRRSSDLMQKLKQFGPIVKFSTYIISNILVKLLLKIEMGKSQAISTIDFLFDFNFGAIHQTSELKLSFECYVYSLRHRFSRFIVRYS